MTDETPNTTPVPELLRASRSGEGDPQSSLAPPAGGLQGARVAVPSARVTALLAAIMLALGLVVGAAIGPAPSSSYAGSDSLPELLPSLIAAAQSARERSAAAAAAVSPPAITETPTPRRHRRRRKSAAAATTSESAEASAAESSEKAASKSKEEAPAKAKPLPPITKVWVIELAGSSFTEALASSAGAPFTDSQAIPSGALLPEWSAIQARALAADASLIATTEPALEETVLQPPCPEGAAGAACQPDTPGALKTADEFLSQTLPKITSTAAYKSNGLIVVTFAQVAPGSDSELPTGSTSVTLSSKPPAGALLISPFVTRGKRPKVTFSPTSPRQSLEVLLHR